MVTRHPTTPNVPSGSASVQAWRSAHAIALLVVILVLTACGGAQADEEPTILTIRQPHATFTPTSPPPADGQSVPQSNAAQSAGSQDANANQTADGNAANDAAEGDPKAIINGVLVNLRTGPDTNYAIVAEVERGTEFDIVGKDEIGSWWQVCCYEDREVWVIDTFVDTIGAVDTVRAVANIPPPEPAGQANVAPPPAPTPVPPPTAPPPPPTAAPPAAPEFGFDLEASEQFPETNVMRVFLFAHDGQDGLEGYSLKVTKNGTELSVGEKTFGPQPGFTWPIADGRQRFQNMKAEFPGESPAGTWEVQLIDSGGSPVGPPATFDLTANEPERELYVRYLKR